MPQPKANSNLLDRAIEWLSPKRAFERQRYRNAVNLMRRQGGYDGARRDRLSASWVPGNASADRWLSQDADELRARARDLIRNNVHARGALDAIVANVVGTGIIPRPAIKDKTADRAVYDAWKRWTEARWCDATGRMHFYELQALHLREAIEAGESLVQKARDPSPNRPVPFVLQSIEAERLASEFTHFADKRTPSNRQQRRGVEIDSTGKPQAYWLWPTPLNDIQAMVPAEPMRVEAEHILHLFRVDRIGQTRGVTWLAQSMQSLRDLGTYIENELMASAVSSCFTVAIKTMDGGQSFNPLNNPDGKSGTDADSNRIERLQPGLVAHLMPGEDVTPINPGRPNSASEPWINLMLRNIAVGTGLSYELVSRDYSRTNFSSNRASALEDRRRFRPTQSWLINSWCQPIYRAFIEAHVLAQSPGFPTPFEFFSNPYPWLEVRWQAPGWEWVDPLKEAQAALLEVEGGMRSRSDVIASSGRDRDEVFEELAQENEILTSLGLNVMSGQSNDQQQIDAEREREAAEASSAGE